jgi:hypothetical protein
MRVKIRYQYSQNRILSWFLISPEMMLWTIHDMKLHLIREFQVRFNPDNIYIAVDSFRLLERATVKEMLRDNDNIQ